MRGVHTMYTMLLVFFAAVLWLGWHTLVTAIRRKKRRHAALARPFPDEWVAIVHKNLPPYSKLSPALQKELQQDMKVFLAEKSYEGCGGLEITDEIRVTIAAQACLLLLNRTDRCYPRLRSVLVYPSTYVAKDGKSSRGISRPRSVRLGESWHRGPVILAWDSVKQGAYNFCDGHNVAMHEFAHQLDQESGATDGAPVLGQRSAYTSWANVFSKEFAKLQKRGKKKSILDSYGATSPAEFFAVATETFFEKPRQMHKKHPELYEELRGFYKVSPLEWL